MNLFRNPPLQLGAILSAMTIVWFVLLPRLCRLEPIEQRLDWLDENRIDASAMFYTELESFPSEFPLRGSH